MEVDEKLLDQEIENQYKEIKQSSRTQRQKLLALREEFGFRETEYKQPKGDDNE